MCVPIAKLLILLLVCCIIVDSLYMLDKKKNGKKKKAAQKKKNNKKKDPLLIGLPNLRMMPVFAMGPPLPTFVSSSGNANGTGDVVNGTASAYHYKDEYGTIGMNVSAGGNASGATGASLRNNAHGILGDSSMNATGNINASGGNSFVFSDIFGRIYGDMHSITSVQGGGASGTGDTQVAASGQALQNRYGANNPLNSNSTQVKSGATGSLSSDVAVFSDQTLTWDLLSTQLFGMAAGKGEGNSQSNFKLEGGNADTGFEANALLSGMNAGMGIVDTSASAGVNATGSSHDMMSRLLGGLSGKGNSQIVGASNLQSNVSGTNQTISAFGDAKALSDGTSNMLLSALTNNRPDGAEGNINIQGGSSSSNKNMNVQNGIKVNDKNGDTLAIGFGSITGNGTENSNGSITVDSMYNQNGRSQVVANGNGQAISNLKNSSLMIGGDAMLQQNGWLPQRGNVIATGDVMGAANNLTGNSYVMVDGAGANGRSMMEANGGGVGPSAAKTDVNLGLNGDREHSVSGFVAAMGDLTNVRSLSNLTDENGFRTLSNLQVASSSSIGASSASASNSGWLKRRKRAVFAVLLNKLVQPASFPR